MKKRDVVQSKEAMKEEARERAFKYESTYHGCSQCTMRALQEVLGLEDELVFKAASCLHGGMPVERKVCGALNAGVMVLGMKYGRASLDEGMAGTLKGMLQVQKLVKRFEQEFGTTACLEITEGQTVAVDEEGLKYLIEHPEVMEEMSKELIKRCSQVVGKTAEIVVEIINEEG